MGNWSQVILAPSTARISWLWMGLLQLNLWSCQLLAFLDNSLTQYGSVCPVSALLYIWMRRKVWDRTKSFVLVPLRKFLKNLSLGNYLILIESDYLAYMMFVFSLNNGVRQMLLSQEPVGFR